MSPTHLVGIGWITERPDGTDEAYLLAYPERPDPRMDLVAASLGARSDRVDTATHLAVVLIGDHLSIVTTEVVCERTMSTEWTDIARIAGRVVLVVAMHPIDAPDDIDALDALDLPAMAMRGEIRMVLVPVT